jgi:integrase
LNLLRRDRHDSGPFFFFSGPSDRYPEGGHRIRAKHVNEAFQKIACKLGMPTGREAGCTLHALRRFFETFCINAGVPQRAVNVWMGHRGNKSMGAIYYSLSDGESQAIMTRVPFSFDMNASKAK